MGLSDRESKKYKMKDLGIETLVGRRVLSARINLERDLIVLTTAQGLLYLTWEGSCCANCYLANVSGAENLIDATILEAKNAEWVDMSVEDSNRETVESMGTNIKTTKGYVTFESRVEHNGYYDGRIYVSDDEPMDQYHCPRYKNELPELKNLEDF